MAIMASKAIVAIVTIFAVGLVGPAFGAVLPRQAAANASAPATPSSLPPLSIDVSVHLGLQILGTNSSAGVQEAIQKLGNFSQALKEEFKSALDNIKGNTTAGVGLVKEFLQNLKQNLTNKAENVSAEVKQDLTDAITKIEAEIQKGGEALNATVANSLAALQTLQAIKNETIQIVSNILADTLKNVTNLVTGEKEKLAAAVKNFTDALKDGVFKQALTNVSANLLQGVNQTVAEIINKLNETGAAGKEIIGNLTSALGEVKDDVKDALNKTISAGAGVVKGVNEVANQVAQSVGAVVGGVVGGVQNATVALGQGIGNAVNTTLTAGGQVVGGLAGGVGNVVGGVAAGVGNVASGVAAGVGSVVGGISGAIGTIVKPPSKSPFGFGGLFGR